MKNLISNVVVGLLLILTLGCKKANQDNFQVMLTDAPFNAEEVNVEIKQVMVNYSKDSTGWVPLQTNAGIYDLLKLQNGVQTVLATGNNSAAVKELRLILGSSNSIKIDSKTFPLTVPNGGEQGLKIKLTRKSSTTLEKLVVDFDAGLSIIKTGADEYKLRPVLKIK